MSFSKAKRFEPEKVCGPPPTAYDPKHPFGTGVISFPKGDRFPQGATLNHLQPLQQDGAMTRTHSSLSIGSTDSSAAAKSVQGKKDHTLCNKQIVDLERANDEKREMEAQVFEFGLKLENLENIRVELVKDIEVMKESHQKDLNAQEILHKTEVDMIQAANREEIKQLENNLQQLVAEHDAESEQIKFEYGKQIDELHQSHATAFVRLKNEHAAYVNDLQANHQEQLSRLETSRDQLEAERLQLHQKCEQTRVTLETKMDEIETLKIQLDVAEEKLETGRAQYEEKLKRLNDNNQTEKEILMWQMSQQRENLVIELKTEFETCVSKKDADFNQQRAKWEIKMNVTEETLKKELTEKEKEIEDAKVTHRDALSQISVQHQENIKNLHKDYEKVIAAKEEKFYAEREQLSLVHHETVEAAKGRCMVELQELQDEFRATFTALERQFEMEKEDLAQAHAKQLAELNSSYESKLAVVCTHHEDVVEELNKNYEKAMDNCQELQQSLDYLRLEFQAVLAAAESKEAQHKAEVEKMAHAIQFKENEITHLGETLRRREKETADEWIQRETSIMAQLTEQNQTSVQEFEKRLQEVRALLHQSREEIERISQERDAARDDVTVFQVQTEAQIAALSEQYDQERAMLIEKLSVQTWEIEEINSAKIQDLQGQLLESQRAFEEIRCSSLRQIEQMEHDHEEAILIAVREALEPVDSELESLRKNREAHLLLKKEYQELQARIEPFRDQLELYEAEKKALLSQAQFAESSMASLASKYTQLIGHQNSKQKIRHLEKLKQDIFNLRKELSEKNLALEKEKKARQKADARVKELSGQKKYDPAEAFKVPESPATAPVVNKAPPKVSVAKASVYPSPAAESKEGVWQKRKPLRPQSQATGFFLSMDDVDKERVEMEREKQLQMENRRKASANFDAFEVDFGTSSSRRETFDIPQTAAKRSDMTRRMMDAKQDNKENISQGLFPNDLSDISVADELLLKNKLKSRVDHLTSTPMQRHT